MKNGYNAYCGEYGMNKSYNLNMILWIHTVHCLTPSSSSHSYGVLACVAAVAASTVFWFLKVCCL